MYSSHTRLSDIIFDDFTVIPVLNRFGITLGVGDDTIESASRRAGVSSEFLLDILNNGKSNANKEGIPFSSEETEWTVGFLEDSNHWFSTAALPNIERHFRALHDRSQETQGNNLEFLWRFFQELKSELLSRIDRDSQYLFPVVRKVICEGRNNYEKCCFENFGESDSVEEKVDDLASFFVIHLRGDYDRNLCMAVVTSLMALEKEVKRSNRLRQRLLKDLSACFY